MMDDGRLWSWGIFHNQKPCPVTLGLWCHDTPTIGVQACTAQLALHLRVCNHCLRPGERYPCCFDGKLQEHSTCGPWRSYGWWSNPSVWHHRRFARSQLELSYWTWARYWGVSIDWGIPHNLSIPTRSMVLLVDTSWWFHSIWKWLVDCKNMFRKQPDN